VRKFLFLIWMMALMTATGPLPAQVAPPAFPGEGAEERHTNFGQLPPEMSLTKKRTVLNDVARCTIERFRPGVMITVAHVPGSKVEFYDVKRLLRARCLELAGYSRLSLSPAEFRGAAYTILYREKYALSPPDIYQTRIDFKEGITPPYPPQFQIAVGLRELADCLSRANKTDAHAAVMALPGSKADDAAYQMLDKHAAVCLKQKGKMKVDRAIMTGLIAEVLYRQAVSTSVVGTGQ
jgi:hypothetical protein